MVLPESEGRRYRRSVAVWNGLAQDRADLGIAAKVLAQGMSCPKVEDESNLKKTLRYLRSFPRCVTLYNF